MKNKALQFARYDYASFGAFTMYSVCSLAIPLMIVAMGKSLNFPLDAGGNGFRRRAARGKKHFYGDRPFALRNDFCPDRQTGHDGDKYCFLRIGDAVLFPFLRLLDALSLSHCRRVRGGDL